MKKKSNDFLQALDVSVLEAELKRETYKKTYGSTLRGTFYSLVVVAAISVLVATLWLPVFQIYGISMQPTLSEGNIVVSLKGAKLEKGDIIGFYYGNKLLVKRYIAGPGDWVNIDEDGNVYVNEKLVEESYIEKKAFGDSNIELPYQVPERRYFVLGDNRSISIDSRNTVVGSVADEQIVGKVVFRVWPLKSFGEIK